MKKYGYVVLVAIVAALVSVTLSTAAQASPGTRVACAPLQGPCVDQPGTAQHRTVGVTVLPRANGAAPAPSDRSADLPGSGGPNWVVLLSGLVLVLAGATAVSVARRRAEEVELPAQTA